MRMNGLQTTTIENTNNCRRLEVARHKRMISHITWKNRQKCCFCLGVRNQCSSPY